MGDVANYSVLRKEESDFAHLALAVMCTPNGILHFGTKDIIGYIFWIGNHLGNIAIIFFLEKLIKF